MPRAAEWNARAEGTREEIWVPTCWGCRILVCFLCGLSVTQCLLRDLQTAGTTTVVISETRGRCGLPPLGVCRWAPPVAPVTTEVGKREGTATKHHPLLLRKHTCLLRPLPDALGSTHMLDLCHFLGQCSTSCMG